MNGFDEIFNVAEKNVAKTGKRPTGRVRRLASPKSLEEIARAEVAPVREETEYMQIHYLSTRA